MVRLASIRPAGLRLLLASLPLATSADANPGLPRAWPNPIQGVYLRAAPAAPCSPTFDGVCCETDANYIDRQHALGVPVLRVSVKVCTTPASRNWFQTSFTPKPGDRSWDYFHPTRFLKIGLYVDNSYGTNVNKAAALQQLVNAFTPYAAECCADGSRGAPPPPGGSPFPGHNLPFTPPSTDPVQLKNTQDAWDNFQRMIREPPQYQVPYQPPYQAPQPPRPQPPPPPTGPTQQELDERRAQLSRRLPLAVRAGDLSLVQTLLKQGADPNQMSIDPPYAPCLILAIQSARGDIVTELLRNRAIPHLGDRVKGRWGLFWAIMTKQPALVQWLIQNNYAGNLNGIDMGGATPLMVAAQFGDAQSIQYLLAAGADPHLRNANTRPDPRQPPDPEDGWTALYYTQFSRCGACAHALRAAGAR